MKSISNLYNLAATGILILVVLVFALPGRAPISAHAASATPTAPVAEAASGCDSNRSIQVSGSAAVNVAPDRVMIQLGVQSNGTTPRAVQAANTAATQRVLAALQSLGIASKDLATDRYVIRPIYDDYDSLYIKGYRINNVIAVTLRDAGRTADVLAAALDAGANQVVNVEFYTSDLRKYRDQARELAMKAAGEKAKALAGAAGALTGCVLHINEDSWSYYNGWMYGRNQNLWTQNTVQNAAPAAGNAGAATDDGPVSLGQISIQARVDVTFALK